MNSINNTINGLASSLLLNVGLTSVAEKLDPVQVQVDRNNDGTLSAPPCVAICNFTPEAGQ